ncbi:Hypothetical protein POVR2_LOCUS85 [uncultured virus]|nr:Hypothetical protein POVR2_LOCUS85 [uncultured virus]
MNNFILSSKADISKLAVKPLRLLVWSLGTFLSDSISGYIVLNSIIGGDSKLLDVTIDIERDVLVRFIVIKRPRPGNLLDWMIKQKNRDYALAAKMTLEEILHCNDREVEATATLFRVLLEPNLNIQEALFELHEEAREYAARLIGAQLGLSELRRR